MTETHSRTDEPAISETDLTLGTIAKSRSQMDYIVEVYRDGERERVPEKQDYAFGNPVYSTTTVGDARYAIIGVIYDSQLVDPDQGRDGPRLSTPDQEMFVPGYVDEKRTLLGVALLGVAQLRERNSSEGADFADVKQTMPEWTLDIDDSVSKLPAPGFEQFHYPDDSLHIEYYDRLISTADRFGAEVTLALLNKLRSETPASEQLLDVIEQKIRLE